MAKLHMDSLTKQPHRKALRLALENLPPELDDTYDDALARINGQDKEDTKIAHPTLGWITHATRPLSMKQLQHALSVEPEQTDLDEETLIDEELLISTCLGLITVDHTSKEVRLVHYTAQKYFEHKLLELLPDNHLRIASTCLTYMSFKTCLGIDEFTSDKEIKALEDRYAFLDYAGSNWGVHAQRNDQSLVQQILHSLSPRATYLSSRLMIGGFKSLTHEYTHKHWDYPVKYEARISRHNMAAYFGLQHTLMTLLSEATGTKEMINSSLLICSARGHQTLVQLLLDRGADINTYGWQGYTPLYLATTNRDSPMIKVLLDRNADTNKRRSASDYTLLRLAVIGQDVASVNVLLDGGADLNALHLNSHWLFNSKETSLYKFRTTVLFDAVSRQQEAIANLLIDRGADVNIGDATPLCCALSERNGRMVSLLINNGVDLRAYGKIEILRNLLERRLIFPSFDELSSENFLGEALVAVANAPEPGNVAEILIKSGAGIDFLSINKELLDSLQTCWGDELLQNAFEWVSIGGPLLDFPLLAAWRGGNETLVRSLLDRGAKTWGVDKGSWLQQAISAKPKVKELVEWLYPGGDRSRNPSLVIYGTIIGTIIRSDDFREMLRKNGYSEDRIITFICIERQIGEYMSQVVCTDVSK